MEGQGKCDLSLTNEKDCIIIDEPLVSSRVSTSKWKQLNSEILSACLLAYEECMNIICTKH